MLYMVAVTPKTIKLIFNFYYVEFWVLFEKLFEIVEIKYFGRLCN